VSHTIRWAYYPKFEACPAFLRLTIEAFEDVSEQISSKIHEFQESNSVLAKVRQGLENLGYSVETDKTALGKNRVPVLFGENGKIAQGFDADAYHAIEKVVVEVEAGRAVTNYQFLKDLFQACVMQDVDYLVIAVRVEYRKSKDFDKVCQFMETLYASNRLQLPLKGVLVIGY
jgi:hypothetical protein